MADNIEKNANKFSQSRPENGREFEQMQSAQNQLLQIQAGRNQNLLEQRMADNSIAEQNALMRQAAELSAMGGNMQVNQATQNAMGRYGLQPRTISSSKQTQQRTGNGVIINNNTTNITTVPANIGGPLQGRPLQFQAGSSAAESNKFKDWINKAFDKQNEQAKKREREYNRRETSLTKSSNKIMRKLEEFSRDITKKLDPRNIGRTVGGQIGTIFKLFGIGYLAANTGKILDGIKSFTDKTKELFSWIKGDKKETPEFLKNLGETLSVSFGRAFFGNKVNEDEIKQHGIFWGFYNKDGTGVLNQFLTALGDKIAERAKLASSQAKMGNISITKPAEAIKELGRYLTEYFSLLIGGEKALGKVSHSNYQSEAETLSSGTNKRRDAEAMFENVTYYGSGYAAGKEKDVQLGAAAYVRSGSQYGNYNIGHNGSFNRYGNLNSTRLAHNALDSQGRLKQGSAASLSLFADYNSAMANKNKKGAAAGALRDLQLMRQYADANTGAMISDPEILKRILGRDLRDSELFNYIVVYRTKTYDESYPTDVVVNNIARKAIIGSVALKTTATVAGVAALFIPGIGVIAGIAIGAGAWGLNALGGIKTQAGLFGAGEALKKAKRDGNQLVVDYVRADAESIRNFWAVYGNFYVVLPHNQKPLSHYKKLIDEVNKSLPGSSLKFTVTDGDRVEIGPKGEDYKKIVDESATEIIEVPGFNKGMAVIHLKDDWASLLSDEYLSAVINMAAAGTIQSTKLAEVSDSTVNEIHKKAGFDNLDSSWSTSNVDAINKFNANFEGKGKLESLSQLEQAAKAGVEYQDKLSTNKAASGYGFSARGEKAANKSGQSAFRNDLAGVSNVSTYSDRPTDSAGSGSGDFNIQNAIDFIAGHAAADSTGWCARNVRAALEAGGLDTTGRPRYGGSYGPWLESHGWEKVTDGSRLPGDVEVVSPTGGHPYGHIQMWGGDTYYSDFKQKEGGLIYGADTKRTRYRYKGSNGAAVSGPRVAVGSLGVGVEGSSNDVNHDTLEGGNFWDVVKSGISKVWNNSKAVVRETADGKMLELVGTQEYINKNLAHRGTPVDVNARPFSGFTRDILRKYSGADYTGGGLTYLDKFGLRNSTDANSRRVLSSLFDENGKLRVNTSGLNPELADSLKRIEKELVKGNEIDIAHVNITAAGIDTTITTSKAQSVATYQSVAGLGGSRSSSESQITTSIQ